MMPSQSIPIHPTAEVQKKFSRLIGWFADDVVRQVQDRIISSPLPGTALIPFVSRAVSVHSGRAIDRCGVWNSSSLIFSVKERTTRESKKKKKKKKKKSRSLKLYDIQPLIPHTRVENPKTRRHRMELIEAAAAAPVDERTKAAAALASKKPPSRLQKRAPASLQLEDAPTACGRGESGGVSASARTAIPLLSPLILSPAPLWEEVDLGRESKEEEEKVRPPVAGPPLPPPAGPQGNGWRHPALPMVAAVEPGSLVQFFQSQCAIVNNVQ